jgi:L-fuculose-phosphate aldolase
MRLESLRAAVADTAHELVRLGLVDTTAGNVSARDPETGLIAIKPTSIAYDKIAPADIVIVDPDEHPVEGLHTPSSETPMHCRVYRTRPDVGAIVHTHSRWATTFACLGREIPAIHYVISSIGHRIRVARYATYGSEELAANAVEALADDNAVLLRNHGVLAVGGSLDAALKNAIRVEFLAEVYWKASMLGEPIILSDEEIDRVRGESAERGAVRF